MKNFVFLIGFLVLGLSACDIDRIREAEFPEIEVQVDEGQLPEYEVDWAEIDVGTRSKKVKVPRVVVVMEEEVVEVPYIDITMPNNPPKKEITLMVEAEVQGEAHEIDIAEVYVLGDRLYVIAELKSTGTSQYERRTRISDQVIINAPETDVTYYIIGERPGGEFNRQYTFIDSRDEISSVLKNGKKIYKK